VDASYLEIYNEQIRDLLAPAPTEADYIPLKPKERIKLETELKKLQKVERAPGERRWGRGLRGGKKGVLLG